LEELREVKHQQGGHVRLKDGTSTLSI